MSAPEAGPHLHPDAAVEPGSAFTWQARRCEASGAPTAARLLDILADICVTAPHIVGVQSSTVRFGDHMPLRIMAALHNLALTRRAPLLATYFPTVGGSAARAGAQLHEAVIDALRQHPAIVRDFADRVPQTNEPGRQAVLLRALAELPRESTVDLHELGCSAGLNLLVAESPNGPGIAGRYGCDVHPVDLATTEGRALLSSYVWVDDTERFARLGAAMMKAASHPARISQSTASDYLAQVNPAPGHVTLVWQSALEPYLVPGERVALDAALRDVAARVPDDATLMYATWEDAGDSTDPLRAFALRVRQWHHLAGDTLPSAAAHAQSVVGTAGAEGCDRTRRLSMTDRVIARGSAHGMNLDDMPGQ